MSDMVDLTDMPEWGPALTSYKNAKQLAQENGDDVALANVEAEWANSKLQLTQAKFSRDAAQLATNAALTEVKAQHPNVPVELYQHLTDPEQIRTAVAKAAEHMGPPPAPATSTDQQSGGETWGGSPGSVGGSGPTTQTDETPDQVVERLSPTVFAKGKFAEAENRQLRKASLSPVLERFEPGQPAR